jgi:tetratricopeptide (TPR) repeat protein
MNPNLPDKKLNEARDLASQSQFSQALPIYDKLTRQFPHKSRLWYEYGAAAGAAGQLELVDRAFNKAGELEPKNTQVMLDIGHQYRELRRSNKARSWYEKAMAIDPKAINPRMAIAILEEQNHRFAEAREAIASCLNIDPKDDQARYFTALLDRRENKIEDAERHLRELIASNPRHEYVQYATRYELAEIFNRTERFEEAMQMLLEAKSIVRRLGNVEAMLREYDQEADQNLRTTQGIARDIIRTWTKEFPERERCAIPRLSFLGGHPRSGTTLLEQILGSHPSVAAFDEPKPFNAVVCRLFNAPPQPGVPRPKIIPPTRLNVIRRHYLEAMEKEWGGPLQEKLILDKNPSPTSKIRVWLKVFPELRVLIALRDPRDVVISCFFQNIPLNPYNANFLTLERTAKHYADLMDVWLAVRQWDGLNAMETRYEDTVADLEKEGRRVTEFLGLKWDEAQARFYEKSGKKNQMYSPTYHDASQPVYARSVARWRAYEKHLAPILPILEPYCRALGYA